MNLRIIQYYIATICAAALIISCLPILENIIEKRDSEKSLESLRKTGELIENFELEYGFLPTDQLVNYANKNKIDIQDPVYKKITGLSQPNHPGWGINKRLGLSLGEKGEDKTTNRTSYPEEAILVMPSYQPSVYPNRDGSIDPQPLSEKNSKLVNHNTRLGKIWGKNGISGLYLTIGGEILKLSPQEAKEKIAIQEIPPSEEEKLQEKIVENQPEQNWLKTKYLEIYGDYNLLRNGELNTPYIIITPQENITATLEATSQTPIPLTLEAKFFNKYKYEINTEEPKIRKETKLKYIYAGNHFLRTEEPLTTKQNETIGINPFQSHCSQSSTTTTVEPPIPPYTESPNEDKENCWKTKIKPMEDKYIAGTKVTLIKDFSIKLKETSDSQWKTFTLKIDSNRIPKETEFLTIKIKNPTKEKLILKKINIKREEITNAPSPK